MKEIEKERELEQELQTMGMDQDADFDRQIEQMINKKIRKIALKSAIAVVLAAVVIFLGVSPLLNLCNMNPQKLNEGNPSRLLSVMRAYYETMYPYREVYGIEVEKEGFGCYTLNMNLLDHTEEDLVIGPTNVTMEMKWGKLSVANDSGGRAQILLGAFYTEDQEEKLTRKEFASLLSEIEKLPQSSYLYLSLSDQKTRKVEDLIKQNSDDFQIEWLQVYEPQCDFQAGLSLNLSAATKESDKRGEMSAGELRQVYLENLALLKENMEIWEDLDMPSNDSVWRSDKTLLEELAEAGKSSDTFETKHYCVSGSRDAVLSYLRSGSFERILVDNVRFSRL